MLKAFSIVLYLSILHVNVCRLQPAGIIRRSLTKLVYFTRGDSISMDSWVSNRQNIETCSLSRIANQRGVLFDLLTIKTQCPIPKSSVYADFRSTKPLRNSHTNKRQSACHGTAYSSIIETSASVRYQRPPLLVCVSERRPLRFPSR